MSHTEKRWIKRVLVAGLLIIGVIHLSIVWAQRADSSEVAAIVIPHDSSENSFADLVVAGKDSSPVHLFRIGIVPKHLPKPTGVFRAL